jgi:uncharacterized protein (DUF302 family)
MGSIATAYRGRHTDGYQVQSKPAFRISHGGGDPGADEFHATRREDPMSRYKLLRLAKFSAFLLLIALWASAAPIDARVETGSGIVRVKSAVTMTEAITRIKADIASKGIKFFMEIDQSKLAADAGIQLRPSTLLVFGNPPLGTQFITSNPNAGLDWPVRLLLTQDDNGDVWAVWSDFEWIARRHNIRDREAQFKMAAKVVQSITSTITTR